MDDHAENKRGERKQTKQRRFAWDTKCSLLVVLTYYDIFMSQVSHRHGLLHVMKS